MMLPYPTSPNVPKQSERLQRKLVSISVEPLAAEPKKFRWDIVFAVLMLAGLALAWLHS